MKVLHRHDVTNPKQNKTELLRAHSIIVLLSICIIALLFSGTGAAIQYDRLLVLIASTLLAVVALFSLSIVIYIIHRK